MNNSITLSTMSTKKTLCMQKPSIFILIFLISFGSVGAVLFTPALPAMSVFFHVSANAAQFTVTAYLLGYALGQLPYGPLSNRFGRKKTIMIGISLELIGAVLSILSAPLQSFTLLIAARFITALGACVGLMMSFTIISDYFEDHHARKAISYITTAFSVVPGLSVAIGGALTAHFSWVSCFYFLTGYGLFLLGLIQLLPETAKQLDKHALHLSNIFCRYGKVISDKKLWIYALIVGCCTSSSYLFSSMAPFIGIHLMGLSPTAYGLFNLIPSIGFFLGSTSAGKLVHTISAKKTILLGIIAASISVILLMIFSLQTKMPAWELFVPIAFLMGSVSLIFPNASVLATQNSCDKPTASSFMSFINLAVAVIAVSAGGFIPLTHVIVLPAILVVVLIGQVCLYGFAKTDV